MKTKVTSNPKPKSSIPHCPYEIPISTIYNPSSNDSDIPVVSIYNPNLNQNTRPPETKPNLQKLWMEKLKAQFHKDQRKKHEFYMAVCFLITLVATGAIIVIMHKSTTKDLLLVHGEFTILNVEYSSKLMHRNSSEFLHTSKEICHLVDMTFLVPGLSDYYRSCHVTAISPNLNVHVLLTFANDPSVTIGQIGLTFIKGLRILNGKTWLGTFSINVQSIGFMISGQEGQWGEWSEWSKCNATERVSTRTRPCLTRDGVKLSSVDRCLLIPGLKGDLDIRKCSPLVTRHSWETEHSRMLNNDKSTTKSSIENNDTRTVVNDTKVDSQPAQVVEVIEGHDNTEEELNHSEPRVRKERTN